MNKQSQRFTHAVWEIMEKLLDTLGLAALMNFLGLRQIKKLKLTDVND